MSKKLVASKILVTSASFLFGFCMLATVISGKNVGAINTALGTSSYKIVKNEEGSQDTEYYKSKYSKLDDVIADTDKLIEEVAGEGTVLIKNENNALPLKDGAKVSTYGVGSYRSTVTSSGSVFASGGSGREVDLKTGLEQAGLKVNPEIWSWYGDENRQKSHTPKKNGMGTSGPLFATINEIPWANTDSETGANTTESMIGEYSDAAIYNIVRISGEGNKDVNRSGTTDTPNGDALTLSNDEIGHLKGLKALKDAGKIKKIIVLLNCTATIDLQFLNDPAFGVDAALQIQAVGTTGFNAVGDILAGKVNPSGKSSDTLWYNNKENPTLTNQAGYEFLNPDNLELQKATEGVGGYEGHYVVYQEGIYLGYRYTETRYEDYVMGKGNAGSFDYSKTVAVPFGYGDSYTSFEYTKFDVKSIDDNYVFSVTVKNTGDYDGKEAVQIYLQKPYTQYNIDNGIEASAVELVGFNKTDIIKKGDEATVEITVPKRQMASYDANNDKTYVLTEGDYYFTTGNGAHNATNNILASKGFTPSNTSNKMDASGNSDLTYKVSVNKLDKETYSTSEATGKKITNLFDDSDLNKYKETKDKSPVKYITRNDWSGTVVLDELDNNDSYTKITMTEGMLHDFRAAWDETLLEKDDVKYPNYGIDSGLTLINMRVDQDGKDIEFDDPIWDTFMDQLTYDEIANFLSNGMRMTDAIPSIGKPITLDHNGPLGVTQAYALGDTGLAKKNGESADKKPSTFPSAGNLAATMNPELIKRVGEMHGENCLWAGYAGMYGPGLNLHRTQYSSRNNEYYSEDGFLTGKVAAIQVSGTQSKGVYAYIKHFVLNDQETNRYGLSTWLNEQSFREVYLEAFDIAIQEGDAHAMMSSYNRVGTRVSGGKSSVLTDWLRGEAGFDGFVVTDMYMLTQMYGLTFYMGLLKMPSGVLCGNDLVDGAIVDAKQFEPYKEGYGKLANAMRLSAKRILYTVCHSVAMNGWDSSTEIVKVLTWWQTTLVSLCVTFGVLTVLAFGFYSVSKYQELHK